MSIHIYNTLTREKEEFKTLSPNKVKMYVCGPTVYDYCHLGHGRAYIAFDIIYRYLKYRGYDVTYVRNVTDLDDKIIARANENKSKDKTLIEKVSILSEEFTKYFLEDMDALGVLRPIHEPKATQYISQMIKIIEKLIEKQHAYAVGGEVYYDVNSLKDYGILSGRKLEDMMAGARVEKDKKKKSPMDFSLWKEAKPNEPWWESPWGKGRPGWHIECSAMSVDLLGEEFDIHGGGQDLIFPHHENEIAQSWGCTGNQPAKYWVHNGFVTINKEKMSKSLGNFFTLRDIFKKYKPQSVRYFLLTQHYRSPVDFSEQLIQDAEKTLERLEDCIRRVQGALGEGSQKVDNKLLEEIRLGFMKTMDDDFNTPQALAYMHDVIHKINNVLLLLSPYMTGSAGEVKKQDKEYDENILLLNTNFTALNEILDVLGIKYSVALSWQVSKEVKENYTEEQLDEYLSKEKLDKDIVSKLTEMRLFFKKEKKWDLSDKIRDFLSEKGYQLRDNATGTECIRK